MKSKKADLRSELSIVDLGNHAKVRTILQQYLSAEFVAEYDAAVKEATIRFMRLAEQHLQEARQAGRNKKHWRTMVSRAYYACYSASRAVRYFVTGFVALEDVKDHEKIGELPGDFRDRKQWQDILFEMRKDRNRADYAPWTTTQRMLFAQPAKILARAEAFVQETKAYLRKRGVQL